MAQGRSTEMVSMIEWIRTSSLSINDSLYGWLQVTVIATNFLGEVSEASVHTISALSPLPLLLQILVPLPPFYTTKVAKRTHFYTSFMSLPLRSCSPLFEERLLAVTIALIIPSRMEESLIRIAAQASGAIASKQVGTDLDEHMKTRASAGSAASDPGRRRRLLVLR